MTPDGESSNSRPKKPMYIRFVDSSYGNFAENSIISVAERFLANFVFRLSLRETRPHSESCLNFCIIFMQSITSVCTEVTLMVLRNTSLHFLGQSCVLPLISAHTAMRFAGSTIYLDGDVELVI